MTYKLAILTKTKFWSNIDLLPVLLDYFAKDNRLEEVALIDHDREDNQPFFKQGIEKAFNAKIIKDEFVFDTLDELPEKRAHLEEYDFVLLRMDPPVHEPFYDALGDDNIQSIVLNNPRSIMELGSKAYLTEIKKIVGDYMPAIKMCRSIEDIEEFKKDYPDIVLKDIDSNGGKGVKRYKETGETDIANSDEAKAFLHTTKGLLAMEWLENEDQADHRIMVVDGEIYGAISRKAPPGGWLCNITSGGSYGVVDVGEDEYKMVELLKPLLLERNAFYTGIDTLLDKDGKRRLSEINVLNVGSMAHHDRVTGGNLCERLAKACVDRFIELKNKKQKAA